MQHTFITTNNSILGGKPIIKGTRISVEIIGEWMESGGTVESIYSTYPHLPKGSVEEALLYLKSAANFK